ncbi:DEAD/DEAH box helicase [Labilibaculum sp. A4]|uniref:DEAD/DEAH box helicase n=1 Tax=Labilibaculum euxinus TaxID=2686357 RepID=UPI000F621672|nr:DEAD/DEAH box helicase [Labilibaculum euxinus]MDQ1772101.1 DEAD/DEAH box helicase [Labilibaculum euxinus]MWN75597.1 DEAD/DEAH box helicase [Labilibaculum euxinus]
MTFDKLEIIDPILKAIGEKGYTHPTPIQEKSIPILLRKRDLLGCAQTGTGKTAAFAIPILQHIYNDATPEKGRRKIKALVVTPTRELAIQIKDSFSEYGKYTGILNTVIFGGVKQGAQTQALNRGVDVLVATPGRLLDLIQQGYISLRDIKYFVLDEADQMLDMGFIHDIRRIIDLLPKRRQSLFFSATMPASIVSLAGKILGNPDRVTVKPEQTTAEKVGQSLYYVSKKAKPKLLIFLLKTEETDSTLVFSRTKHGADKVVKGLQKAGIPAEAIHGNKSQNARQLALSNFKNGSTKVLVATDIAARGIDVSELSLVVNYDLPNIPETYVHRIGRTGRASASGNAISFCDTEEKPYLKDIQKLIRQDIDVVKDHPFLPGGVEDNAVEEVKSDRRRQQPRSSKSSKPSNSSRSSGSRSSNSSKSSKSSGASRTPNSSKPSYSGNKEWRRGNSASKKRAE